MYSQIVFAIAQLNAEMPYSLLCAVAFFVLLYYPAGFDTRSVHAGYQFFVVLVTELFSVALGQVRINSRWNIELGADPPRFAGGRCAFALDLHCGTSKSVPLGHL